MGRKKKLLRPYYLNECDCGIINECKICMSKRRRRILLAMTKKEKFQHNLHAAQSRAKLTPEKREARAQYQREYQAEYRAKKLKEERRRLRELAKNS